MSQIPLLLERGAAFVFFSLASLLVAAYTAFSADASKRAGLARRGLLRLSAAVAVFLACWFGAALVTNDAWPLVSPDLRLPIALAVAFGPMLAAVAILFASRSLRAVNQ